MAKNINPKEGLTSKEVNKLRKQYGYNEILTKKEFTALRIIISQFSSLLIIILIIAGSISIFLGELIDGIAIFTIVLINSTIGFIQEYKAENAVKALKKMMVQTTVVIREGQKKSIEIKDLVPEDIVMLYEGDKVPADLKILKAYSLQADESVLTGESNPVDKTVSDGKEGILYKGTIITTGKTQTKVIATGSNTEFGKIVQLVAKQTETKSPLAIQLNELGKKIGLLILILTSILFIIGTIKGISTMEMLMTSVALGVSAIPEGMPIIVTLTLTMGVQLLAQKKAIVRKMSAVETLGATTVICSDKTGTLTLNEMTVKVVNTNFNEKNIEGLGYSFKKQISLNSFEEKKLLEICENCNNAFIGKHILGDPTEIALKVLTRKARYTKFYKQIDEKVFNSERKMMSTLHNVGKTKEIFSKGAYEEILKRCKYILKNGEIKEITEKNKKEIKKIAEDYSSKALRVLAFAYKTFQKDFDEKDLIFVGIVGMTDPPRKSVNESIKIAQHAGIKVKIITGDNPITAKAIGENVGLTVNRVVTGDEIDKLNDKELIKLIYETEIFARTNPVHKYRIVDLLKKNNEVVAVTGDGVNDAPALKHSDVGIAMGIKGTEATKEVADIILKDDNFSTIVNTIKEGRRIYDNILAFIKYMLSANYDSIMTVALLTMAGFPLPILPLQILWINIATDALPALALGKSEASPEIMERKPRPKQENIFKKFFIFIFVAVILQTISNLLIYFYGLELDELHGIETADLSIASYARTLVFTEIVLFELFFAFVCKEEKKLSFKSIKSNKSLIWAVSISLLLQIMTIYAPFMQKVFKTLAIGPKEWLILILFASAAFLVPPITNFIKKIAKT